MLLDQPADLRTAHSTDTTGVPDTGRYSSSRPSDHASGEHRDTGASSQRRAEVALIMRNRTPQTGRVTTTGFRPWKVLTG